MDLNTHLCGKSLDRSAKVGFGCAEKRLQKTLRAYQGQGWLGVSLLVFNTTYVLSQPLQDQAFMGSFERIVFGLMSV